MENRPINPIFFFLIIGLKVSKYRFFFSLPIDYVISTEITTDYSDMTLLIPASIKGGVTSENDFEVKDRQNRLLDVLKRLECTKPGFLRNKS